MKTTMPLGSHSGYPPSLTEHRRHFLISSLKDWSIANGLAVRPSSSYVSPEQDPSGFLATTAPVTLFPSLIPRACFEEATAVQTVYNELYSAIARDEPWLAKIIEELVEIDDFIAKLWQVHLSVKKEGYVQPISLGLFRSDYMVHIDPELPDAKPSIKQVEFNTIASSFAGLSAKVSALHRHLLNANAYPSETADTITQAALQSSNSVQSLAAGLVSAHKAYGPSRSSYPLCILFLVQEPERNVFDQRHIEYSLLDSGIQCFRLPFDDILPCILLASDRTLVFSPPHSPSTRYEVTTVYFRAGYSPEEYKGPDSWTARTHIELSAAIKCPSILTHLAGSKKVQQVLATPNSPHLSRLMNDKAKEARLLSTFTRMYPLDQSDAGNEARRLALNEDMAQRYVLKPQREGGGNNTYRKAIPGFLRNLPESHWPAYILMEMIEPPPASNIVVRNGTIEQGGVICELGVYGVCLWRQGSGDDGGEILENSEAGYLLRTKGDKSEEGGVAAGFGAVDSCCLIDG